MRYYAFLVVALAACTDSTSSSNPAPPPPSADLSGHTPLHMRNCPSAVATASTQARPTADGMDVTITSTDPNARRQIAERAALEVLHGESLAGLPAHTGMHTGTGGVGHCPIIHASTTVTYEPVENGVVVHVRASKPSAIAQLQDATFERMRAWTAPTS